MRTPRKSCCEICQQDSWPILSARVVHHQTLHKYSTILHPTVPLIRHRSHKLVTVSSVKRWTLHGINLLLKWKRDGPVVPQGVVPWILMQPLILCVDLFITRTLFRVLSKFQELYFTPWVFASAKRSQLRLLNRRPRCRWRGITEDVDDLEHL